MVFGLNKAQADARALLLTKEKTRNPLIQRAPGDGADSQIRTGDLILTKDALYRLSYISMLSFDNVRILSQRI